ncbi:unnamed protein product [Parascedosporium putredinis]|uniref:Uncharacterized protein n=1 Tax=Parascedosporium putredinis TaxID=1442378 RepID=A0A9P1GWS2_9PEZI|nr:unnamed protein product [Parascedosporium putredinis]CAI7988418.1 unnamed protein product [Parascedosporium putredinis]
MQTLPFQHLDHVLLIIPLRLYLLSSSYALLLLLSARLLLLRGGSRSSSTTTISSSSLTVLTVLGASLVRLRRLSTYISLSLSGGSASTIMGPGPRLVWRLPSPPSRIRTSTVSRTRTADRDRRDDGDPWPRRLRPTVPSVSTELPPCRSTPPRGPPGRYVEACVYDEDDDEEPRNRPQHDTRYHSRVR